MMQFPIRLFLEVETFEVKLQLFFFFSTKQRGVGWGGVVKLRLDFTHPRISIFQKEMHCTISH